MARAFDWQSKGHRFDSDIPLQCLGGVMVATLVLEASGEIRVGSSPTWGTILKHTAEVGSARQGDPKAYVVSVF